MTALTYIELSLKGPTTGLKHLPNQLQRCRQQSPHHLPSLPPPRRRRPPTYNLRQTIVRYHPLTSLLISRIVFTRYSWVLRI